MILFVCSQGRIRSRTAEVLALMGGALARSCGTDKDALIPVSNELLRGAETIICMEQSHAREVKTYMGSEGKCIVSLGIEDVWNPFDPILIEQLISLTLYRTGDARLADAMERGWKHLEVSGIDFLNGGVLAAPVDEARKACPLCSDSGSLSPSQRCICTY